MLNDGKLHDSSLRYLFSHKVGYKSYAKANGSSLFKRQLRGALFYESNESMSHESMSQGYFLTKYYILNNCLPVLKLAYKYSTLRKDSYTLDCLRLVPLQCACS